MTLLFFIACLFAVVLWFWHKDRLYLKKDLRETVGPEMKIKLNLPRSHTHFEKGVAESRFKRPASRRILEEMNKQTNRK